METDEKIGIAFKLVLAGVGMYAVKKIGEEFGLFDTKQEKDLEQATEDAAESATTVNAANPLLAFNPNYLGVLVQAYNKQKKPKIFNATYNLYGLTEADYKTIVGDLKASANLFDDDEDAVYGIFRKIQTQWQLSLLSSMFSHVYKKDLLQYLKSFMSAKELDPIIQIVKKYPQYRKA